MLQLIFGGRLLMHIHSCTAALLSDCCHGYTRDETILVSALLLKLTCVYTNTPCKKCVKNSASQVSNDILIKAV